jgi:hypothetical protein
MFGNLCQRSGDSVRRNAIASCLHGGRGVISRYR